MENKSSLHLDFEDYITYFSTKWKHFTLNYDDYYIEKYGANYYKFTNTLKLIEFLKSLVDRKYIDRFDSTSDYWLKVDGRKCRLVKDKKEIGKEFETSERIHDKFDTEYFAKKREQELSLEYF